MSTFLKLLKNTGFTCLLLVCSGGSFAQSLGTPKSQILHVSRSWTEAVLHSPRLHLQGTIDGVKVELRYEYGGHAWVVKPGDYPVSLKKEVMTDRGIERDYEVELVPGKRYSFELCGLEE